MKNIIRRYRVQQTINHLTMSLAYEVKRAYNYMTVNERLLVLAGILAFLDLITLTILIVR